jgi:hAT family C-terminal dimerisation region
MSDIDRYFDSPRVDVNDMEDPNRVCNWRKIHRKYYPQIAAAARDSLVIPASEVSVARLFSAGSDILGLRRYSIKGGF